MSKKDLIQGCMESFPIKVTVPEFEAAYCNVCVNPECVRSRWADSVWMQRMHRQEQALWSPVIVDPAGNPILTKLATQAFESIDVDERSVYGGWVSIGADGKVIHQAKPETETKSADKLEASLRAMKSQKEGQDPVEAFISEHYSDNEIQEIADTVAAQSVSGFQPMYDPMPSDEELYEEEVPPPVEVQVKDTPQATKPPETETKPEYILEPRQAPQPQQNGTQPVVRNTPPPPSGGILLGGPTAPQPRQQASVLANREDTWGVPTEKKTRSRLTVRLDTGTVVKKE